jgi:Fe2+ or Zn2+ uptake regulation protein
MMTSKDLLYCQKCGGMIDFRFKITLLSHPAKYQMACKDCNALKTYTETERLLALEELENGRSS